MSNQHIWIQHEDNKSFGKNVGNNYEVEEKKQPISKTYISFWEELFG